LRECAHTVQESIERLELQQHEYESEAEGIGLELVVDSDEWRKYKADKEETLRYPADESNIEFSEYHECGPSPVNACVYDTVNDPARDGCLFCGDPEERK